MKYVSPLQMKKHIVRMYAKFPKISVLGLDVGKKFIGVALSDPLIQHCKPFKTYEVNSEEDDENNEKFYAAFQNLVMHKHVKGIVCGYPLDHHDREMVHCRFIKYLIFRLREKTNLSTPVLLVNEYNTTKQAKRVILDVQQEEHSDNPDMIFRKRLYDKYAAKIILQEFIDYYHDIKELSPINQPPNI